MFIWIELSNNIGVIKHKEYTSSKIKKNMKAGGLFALFSKHASWTLPAVKD
jgi:hypothetical protein